MLRHEYPSIRFSHVYRTKARDMAEQSDFLNAVAAFEKEESPLAIREKLAMIERTLKKHPPFPKGPRTIDLDFLLYGDEIINMQELIIPHPRMHERRFVLEPLTELLYPQAKHPEIGQTWEELLKKTLNQNAQKTHIQL